MRFSVWGIMPFTCGTAVFKAFLQADRLSAGNIADTSSTCRAQPAGAFYLVCADGLADRFEKRRDMLGFLSCSGSVEFTTTSMLP